MAEQPSEVVRSGDRRTGDRRRQDRRAPLPPWRRPWAFVAYGVVGAVALMLLFGGGEEEGAPEAGEVVTVAPRPGVNPDPPPAANAPPVDAFGTAGFERLVARGQAAVGQRVRAELLCGSLSPVTLSDVEQMNRSIAELADANARVPGAECKWGAQGEAARPDLLLLVPPALAGRFASAPVVVDDFVERRRVLAEVEWLGRSEALALRTVGVLRALRAQ